ncbi:MAG TPA: glycosyltransferase family 4 protein [Thermoanaerobaculia bacterium]|nr:glycosyltransferase family 4 protein [Thermoanaerobaculia bacterium]
MTAPARRNILYVQSSSEIGGSDVCLLRLVAGLDRTRFRAFVALPKEGPLSGALRAGGATVAIEPAMHRLSTRLGAAHYVRYALGYPLAVWRLARLIRREAIDLVHTNTLHALHGFAAAWLTGRPHVWHVREIVLQSRVMRRLEFFLARHFSDRILAMSAAIAAMFGRAPRQLSVLHDGIDLQAFRPHQRTAGVLAGCLWRRPAATSACGRDARTDSRRDAGGPLVRRELGLAEDDVVMGVVCRLDHWKGVDVFLRAAARVPDAKFVVAGGAVEGREEFAASLHALARELGLDVRFTGWRYGPDRIAELHAALDVLVLPSVWPEPFGLVLLEAMASGKPVIATRHGGPVEIVADGETGLLVAPGSVEELVAAMHGLSKDAALRARMGRAARARVEREFDETRYLAAVQRVYREVLA